MNNSILSVHLKGYCSRQSSLLPFTEKYGYTIPGRFEDISQIHFLSIMLSNLYLAFTVVQYAIRNHFHCLHLRHPNLHQHPQLDHANASTPINLQDTILRDLHALRNQIDHCDKCLLP